MAARWLNRSRGIEIACVLALIAMITSSARLLRERQRLNAQFIAAVQAGNLSHVRRLLDQGADPNAHGRNGGRVDAPAVVLAASYGYPEVTRLLLERGADIQAKDEYDRTVLICAVGVCDARFVRELLQRGAHVNAVDYSHRTALMYAASDFRASKFSDCAEVTKALIERGADLAIQDASGQTAMQLAKGFRNLPVAQVLEAAGAKE